MYLRNSQVRRAWGNTTRVARLPLTAHLNFSILEPQLNTHPKIARYTTKPDEPSGSRELKRYGLNFIATFGIFPSFKMSAKQNKQMTDEEVSAAFTSFYLQRATQEFSEDLDKIRNADDFRSDAIPILISALSQGTSMFSSADQRRIVAKEGLAKKSG